MKTRTKAKQSSSANITKKLQDKPAALPRFHKNEITYHQCLGKGIYGTVNEASWQGKTVAVKKIHRTPKTEAACKKEKEIMTRLADCQRKQPNLHVINCHGYKKSPHNYNLILDYASNGTVEEYLKKNTVTSIRHYQIAIDTAKGLDYLHSVCKITHADMKPANLLLDADMNVKIIDYGFSLHGKMTTIHLLGTPDFIAPELVCFVNGGIPYSPASDVYAFSIILYDIFVGKEPYPDVKDVQELFEKISKGERPTIPETCPVKNLIPKCWDQNPKKRPGAKELIVETENYYKLAMS